VESKKGIPGSLCVSAGNDLMERPDCFVLVDNRIISPETVGPLKAIVAAFMSFFVFKIAYPKKLYPLLNFLERYVALL